MTEPKNTTEGSATQGSTSQDIPFTLSKEDTAFFIRNLWEAVLAPAWTKDDIIEFGKAVFAKVPLSKIDDKKFDLLLPYLTKMSETLAQRLHTRIVEEHEKLVAAARTAPEIRNPAGTFHPVAATQDKPPTPGSTVVRENPTIIDPPAAGPTEPNPETKNG